MENKVRSVSVGLPVFNGESYLAKALDSLLAQSYEDFELIISDNASTDRTQDICQAYLTRDRRICYSRNPENIGAMQNWYRTIQLSGGEYFLGAAHDDLYHPEFLRKCVEVLDQDPKVVVCYTKTKMIDEHGNLMRGIDVGIDTTSPKPNIRLYNGIRIDYLCIQLLGVMRLDALRKIPPYTGYYGCDRNILAELCLLGQVYEVAEYLFFHRLHSQALGAAKGSGRSLQELLLLDPGINWGARFPTVTRFRNYFMSVTRIPLAPGERFLCYLQLVRLMMDKLISRIKHRWKPLSV